MTAPHDRRPAPELPGYTFRRALGHGGFADVYLYEQDRARRDVAVKVLRERVDRTRHRAAITAEAEVMAQLSAHPYIVTIYDTDVAPDGRPYLVMEHYSRPNFARRARGGGFDVPEVLRVGVQVASAVETAHRAGIVHRDIKPANILTSDYGRPGLTDFGIATRAGTAASQEGALSVPWAAPELFHDGVVPDRRADIYALGATLWTLLVGRSPFESPGGDNSDLVLWCRIEETPVPPTGRPDAPASLERVLRQAMAKRPDDRFATALDLARALQGIQTELHLAVEPVALPDLGLTAPQPRLRPPAGRPVAPPGPAGPPSPDAGTPPEPDQESVVTVLRSPRTAGPRPAGPDAVPVVPGALPHLTSARPAPPALALPPLPPLPPPPPAPRTPPAPPPLGPGGPPGPARPVPLEYGPPTRPGRGGVAPGPPLGPGPPSATPTAGRRSRAARRGTALRRPVPGARPRWLVVAAVAVPVLAVGGAFLVPRGGDVDLPDATDGTAAGDPGLVATPSGREILHDDPPTPAGTATRLGAGRVRFTWSVTDPGAVAGYVVTREDRGHGPRPDRQPVTTTSFELTGLSDRDRPCLSVSSTGRTGRTSPPRRICVP